MDSDHNLLFGVLALQADLIDPDQFVQACSDWASRRHEALADLLLQRNWISALDREDVARLMGRKLGRHGGDVRAALDAVADARVRSVIAPDAQLSAVFRLDLTPPSSLPPTAGHVLVESLPRPADDRSRYTLTRLHAQGGLGQVWIARDGDLNREVALKELKPDQAKHPDAWRRFLKEAQVTGQLEHPNIVPVYELSRRDEDDQPFYTMKFVRGQTLRDAIREYHATANQEGPSASPSNQTPGAADPTGDGPAPDSNGRSHRLELRRLLGSFVSVCNAIGYAHSRGVIHRDLKPSNVVLGGFGEVIVLDWGLAKLVSAKDQAGHNPWLSDEAQAEATVSGRVLGTPAYMSPEQARGELDQLDQRTDIYGLGAILFEILTGGPPHRGRDTKELLAQIIDADTPRVRSVNSLAPAALEAIAAKAMAKSATDRYQTAQDLADDVQRWLADEPVRVYRDPWGHRVARWARRHRAWTQAGAAALILVTLVSLAATLLVNSAREEEQVQRFRANQNALTAGTQRDLAIAAQEQQKIEAERAKRSEDEARAVLRFLQNNVLAAARPRGVDGGLGIDTTIREALDAAEPRIDLSFKDQPLVEAAVRQSLGQTYAHLSEWQLAITQQRHSLQLFTDNLGPNDIPTLHVMQNLAESYRAANMPEEAVQLFQETVARWEATRGPDDPETLDVKVGLADALLIAGQIQEAQSLLQSTINKLQETVDPSHPALRHAKEAVPHFQWSIGNLAEAIPFLEQTVKRLEAIHGADHVDTLSAKNNLAKAYQEAGQLDRAIALLKETLERERAVLGTDHDSTLYCLGNLGFAYVAAGRFNEALPILQETYDKMKAKLGADDLTTLKCLDGLADLYAKAGDSKSARQIHEKVLERRRAKLGPDHPDTLASASGLARTLVDQNELHRAIDIFKDVLERTAELGKPVPTAISQDDLANAYVAARQVDQAIPLLQEALTSCNTHLSPNHPTTLLLMNDLAVAYQSAGRLEEAVVLYKDTLNRLRAAFGPDDLRTLRTASNLGYAYNMSQQAQQAIPILEDTLQRETAIFEPDNPYVLSTTESLAKAYWNVDRFEDSGALFQAAVERASARFGPDHPTTLRITYGLARSLQSLGKLDQAARLFEDLLRRQPSEFGLNQLAATRDLGATYSAAGQHDRALPLLRKALEQSRQILGPEHAETLSSMNYLADAYQAAGRLTDAAQLYVELANGARQRFGLAHPTSQQALHNLVACYINLQQVDKAEPLARELVAFSKQQAGVESREVASELALLGRILLKAQKFAEAEPLILEALAIREKTIPDDSRTFSTRSLLGGSLLGQRRYAEAEPLLRSGYAGMKERESTIPPQGMPLLLEAIERLVQINDELDRKDEAGDWRKKLEEAKAQRSAK